MVNYMAEVAKMLGVELEEIFEIEINEYKSFQFRFTEGGFQGFNGKTWTTDTISLSYLNSLLTGKYTIKRKPWKPKESDTYYYVNQEGHAISFRWWNTYTEILLYKLGNCYRTEEEAEANRDKWAAFYASDEVLEV